MKYTNKETINFGRTSQTATNSVPQNNNNLCTFFHQSNSHLVPVAADRKKNKHRKKVLELVIREIFIVRNTIYEWIQKF